MSTMSACGVLCAGCPAFHARQRGVGHRNRTAAAWERIYGVAVDSGTLTCDGCLSSDAAVYPSSRTCGARLCCRSKGFASCAECDVRGCALLDRAQAVWDGVPAIAKGLSPEDRIAYAAPYFGHRERLEAARGRR